MEDNSNKVIDIKAALIAAQSGNVEQVELYLTGGGQVTDTCDIQATNNLIIKQSTLLHEAAANGHIGLMKYLIEAGATIDAKTTEGWTPLHAAACNSKKVAALLLVKHGADPWIEDNNGQTPIQGALSEGLQTLSHDIITLAKKVNQDAPQFEVKTNLEQEEARNEELVSTIIPLDGAISDQKCRLFSCMKSNPGKSVATIGLFAGVGVGLAVFGVSKLLPILAQPVVMCALALPPALFVAAGIILLSLLTSVIIALVNVSADSESSIEICPASTGI